jgi:hypothetical protein
MNIELARFQEAARRLQDSYFVLHVVVPIDKELTSPWSSTSLHFRKKKITETSLKRVGENLELS